MNAGSPARSRAARKAGRAAVAAAWIAGLALVALHLGVWRPRGAETLFGCLPEELAWRLAWMGLAWLYLLWFTSAIWRREAGSDEAPG